MNPDNGHPSCLFLALSCWYAVCVFAGLGYKPHHLGPGCRPSAIPDKHTKQAIASLNPSFPLQSRIYLEAIRIPISLDPLVVTGGPAGAIPNMCVTNTFVFTVCAHKTSNTQACDKFLLDQGPQDNANAHSSSQDHVCKYVCHGLDASWGPKHVSVILGWCPGCTHILEGGGRLEDELVVRQYWALASATHTNRPVHARSIDQAVLFSGTPIRCLPESSVPQEVRALAHTLGILTKSGQKDPFGPVLAGSDHTRPDGFLHGLIESTLEWARGVESAQPEPLSGSQDAGWARDKAAVGGASTAVTPSGKGKSKAISRPAVKYDPRVAETARKTTEYAMGKAARSKSLIPEPDPERRTRWAAKRRADAKDDGERVAAARRANRGAVPRKVEFRPRPVPWTGPSQTGTGSGPPETAFDEPESSDGSWSSARSGSSDASWSSARPGSSDGFHSAQSDTSSPQIRTRPTKGS